MRALLIAGSVLSINAAISTAGVAQNADEAAYRSAVKQYCGECHNPDDYAGGLDLESILDAPVHEHAPEWERAIRRLRAGVMPPPGQERPSRERYLAMTEWLENQVDQHAPVNPG